MNSEIFPYAPITNYGKYGKVLGKGSFGEVYELGDNHVDKIIENVDGLPSPDAFREIALNIMVDSSDITRPTDIYISDRGTTHIIMPKADGDLREFLWKGDYIQRKRWILHTCSGLASMHSKQIIHCDIKPANVLIFGETAQLADLGISKAYICVNTPSQLEGAFTVFYRPPEKILGGVALMPADIWALGVTIAEVMLSKDNTLYSPFIKSNNRSHDIDYYLKKDGIKKESDETDQKIMLQNIIQKIGFPEITNWPEITDLPGWSQLKNLSAVDNKDRLKHQLDHITDDTELKNLLLGIFQYNPNSRPNIYQIFKHPWFSDFTIEDIPKPLGCYGSIESLMYYPKVNRWEEDRIKFIDEMISLACHYRLQNYSLGLGVYLLDNSQPLQGQQKILTTACLNIAQTFAEKLPFPLDYMFPEKDLVVWREILIQILNKNQFFLGTGICFLLLNEQLRSSHGKVFDEWAFAILKLTYLTDLHFKYSASVLANTLYAITEKLFIGEISNVSLDLPVNEVINEIKGVARSKLPSLKFIFDQAGCKLHERISLLRITPVRPTRVRRKK